jgi:uncharacterized protein (DUF3084 family)
MSSDVDGQRRRKLAAARRDWLDSEQRRLDSDRARLTKALAQLTVERARLNAALGRVQAEQEQLDTERAQFLDELIDEPDAAGKVILPAAAEIRLPGHSR